jgi:hypothetical protein
MGIFDCSDRSAWISSGKGFTVTGLVCLSLGSLLRLFFYPGSGPWEHITHFAAGFFLGISIVFLIAGLGMNTRRRSHRENGLHLS